MIPPGAGDNTIRQIAITDTVDWRVSSTGTASAQISNTGDTRGRLTAETGGTGTISVIAGCGDLSGTQGVTISGGDDSTSDQLSFDESGTLILSLNNRAGVELNVSTGTTFSEDNIITSGITCTFVNDITSPGAVDVVTVDGSRCRVQPRTDGTATVTATRASGGSVSINVDVETPGT